MSTRPAFLLSLCAAFCCALPAPGYAATRLSESGSTLLHPLLDAWAAAYETVHPDVLIETAASGSGAGIAAAIAGQVQIGASDAPLRDDQMSAPDMLNIPLAVSAQQVDYHVPELGKHPLKVDGRVLAGIYDASVAFWDDRRIAALNPGASLPHRRIVPIRRAEASGDTYLFTEYLSRSSPQWDRTVHYGTRVIWPRVDTALEDLGNTGVLQLCYRVPYSIAYVGISLLDTARTDGLSIASLQNGAGEFLQPDPSSIAAAVRSGVSKVPKDGRITLVDVAGPGVYPIVNFEYAIVRQRQSAADVAAAVRAFLAWTVDPAGGSSPSFLDQVHFLALPDPILELSRAQIASIQGP
jgi:phosphate transport system substrate-binding protein